MKKKIGAILLTIILMVGLLAGCGQKSEGTEENSEDKGSGKATARTLEKFRAMMFILQNESQKICWEARMR